MEPLDFPSVRLINAVNTAWSSLSASFTPERPLSRVEKPVMRIMEVFVGIDTITGVLPAEELRKPTSVVKVSGIAPPDTNSGSTVMPKDTLVSSTVVSVLLATKILSRLAAISIETVAISESPAPSSIW